MANDLEYSGKRRGTVDSRLGTLETRVEEEALLRAGMDEDLTKLHVERDLLQSLHDTQSDHTRRLTKSAYFATLQGPPDPDRLAEVWAGHRGRIVGPPIDVPAAPVPSRS